MFKSYYHNKILRNICFAFSIKIMLSLISNNKSMKKKINIQQALFVSLLKKASLKIKNIISISYLILVIVKVRLLIFLVFSQHGLALK